MSSPELGAEITKQQLHSTPQATTKPTFDIVAIHAQITSNALAFDAMAHVRSNLRYPVRERPSPTIMTAHEAGQIRAAAVVSGVVDGRQVMSTLFRGSLAGSDSEALLSMYEKSKFRTTEMKKSVEDNGRWWRG